MYKLSGGLFDEVESRKAFILKLDVLYTLEMNSKL